MTALALALVAVAAGAAPGDASWLDKLEKNWNQAGAKLPKAPAGHGDAPSARCDSSVRPPTSEEDRAVALEGWSLLGPAYVYDRTRAFLAMSSVDGMCRPLGYQGFVFVDGKFAGTLAPEPMDSGKDGALDEIRLQAGEAFAARFRRHGRLNYVIETTPKGPLVVPKAAEKEP